MWFFPKLDWWLPLPYGRFHPTVQFVVGEFDVSYVLVVDSIELICWYPVVESIVFVELYFQ